MAPDGRQTLAGVALADGRVVDLQLDGSRIAAMPAAAGPARRLALPLPVDPHLHLDKTHTAGRAGRGAPGLFGAIEATRADKVHWTAADIRARAGRALAEAETAGMRGVRTHVDWEDAGEPRAWGVLGAMAREWRGRITIQRAALCPLDLIGDPALGPDIAVRVAECEDAVLGAFVYRNDALHDKLARVFALAERHALPLDFHVDEGLDPEARGIETIIELTARHGMAGRVLCGHACSLSVRPAPEAAAVLARAAEAGVGLCALPTTNTWLQDAAPGRTPRLRGIAPLHEARAAGVEVMLGADNVADPFYPYGAYDPLDVLRQAAWAAHLEPGAWIDAVTTTPARWLGLDAGTLEPGAPADFLLLPAPGWDEALRHPCISRRVFRAGHETSAPLTNALTDEAPL
ncbi:amidohydrolase [Rhodobacteraceae bacterium WD3A24]|nr:amidohydrolase [Rhodobacteraceae bacterium WD3A24]